MLKRFLEIRPAVQALTSIARDLKRLADYYEADLKWRGLLPDREEKPSDALEVGYTDHEKFALEEARAALGYRAEAEEET